MCWLWRCDIYDCRVIRGVLDDLSGQHLYYINHIVISLSRCFHKR